jgi:AraC-like DNA-binding protein
MENHRGQASRKELVERLSRAIREDGRVEPLKDVHLHRESSPAECVQHSISAAAFCIIAQGSKDVFLGGELYQYDPMHYLLATAELPIATHITEATPEQPFLGLVINLDPVLVSSVMVETGYDVSGGGASVRAMDVSPLTADLLDAVVRLARLLDTPADAPFLMPLIVREVVYRLLQGDQGDRLCHIALQEANTHRITQAIRQLREDFDHDLKVDDIAQDVSMSTSSFYHHFKAVTGLSPLQFQKRIRLQEARRLMLGEGLDAGDAGFRVGYNDASHFSREYKRLFGDPPMRDVQRLREETKQAAQPGSAS